MPSKPTLPQPTDEQRAEFRRLSTELSKRIVASIEGEHPPFVVLEALCMAHRYAVSLVPPELVGYAASGMAAYAGELFKAALGPQNAPPGTSVH